MFLLEMILISALLYLLYYTLFRGKASFTAQRALLISIPIIAIASASISFRGIEIRGYGEELISEIVADQSHQSQVEAISRSAITQDGFRVERADKRPFVVEHLALSIWASIAILLSTLFVCRIIKIRSMRRVAIREREDDYTIYKFDIDDVLFSFCRGVYISKSIDSERFNFVIQHELAHIRKFHYVDKLIVEALSILIWFNPIIKLIQRELSLIHEYEADRAVVESGADIKSYKMFIFEVVTSSVPSFANGINSSQIKKRFTAMKTNYRVSHKLLRALMTLFVFVAIAATSVMYVEANEPPRSIIEETPHEDIESIYFNKDHNIVTIAKKDGTEVSQDLDDPLKVNIKSSSKKSTPESVSDNKDQNQIRVVKGDSTEVSQDLDNTLKIKINSSSEDSTPKRAPSVDARRDQLFVAAPNRRNKPIYVVRCKDHTKVYIGMRIHWDRHWCVLSENIALADPKTQDLYMLHNSSTGLPLEKVIWIDNLKGRYIYHELIFPPLDSNVDRVEFVERVKASTTEGYGKRGTAAIDGSIGWHFQNVKVEKQLPYFASDKYQAEQTKEPRVIQLDKDFDAK